MGGRSVRPLMEPLLSEPRTRLVRVENRIFRDETGYNPCLQV